MASNTSRFPLLASLMLFLALDLTPVSASALEILTVCDSITQGFQRTGSGHVYGKTSPGNGAANVGGYQPRLNNMLDANIEPSNVYNWGIGGETSSQTANRINSVLDSRSADYILLLCGANDLYHGISASANKANLAYMVDRSLEKGVIPILSELTPNRNFGYYFDFQIWGDYNPNIRQLAAQKNVPLAYMYGKGNDYNNPNGWVSEMRKCWLGGPGCSEPLNSGDLLHLSDKGYDVMTKIWFDVIWENEPRVNFSPIFNILLD